MKKTVIRRITASVLSLLLLLTPVLSIAVQAQENVETEPYEYKIPTEIINEEAIEENGHIGRVFASEGDMNEICLINDDGTSTMYLFDYPVKYLDSEDGIVKDKSNKLKESKRNNYLYVNDENDIKTYFPKKITKKPVITEVGDYKIEIGIVTDSKYSKKGELLEDNYVFYNQAFGEDTAIGYTVSFNGYKEEIILYSEQAPTSYSFEIYCEGLEVSNRGGILTFAEESTGKTVFTSDPFYIYDSSEEEKSYIETDYILEKTDDYSYLLTVSLDEEYIASGLTYPVYIDPTIRYDNENYINDVAIYSNKPDSCYGSAITATVGYYNEDFGIGRMLISFPEMVHDVSLFNYLSAEDIITVQLFFYCDPNGSLDTTLNVHEFYGADPFSESSATWNSVYADGYSSSVIDSVEVGSLAGGYYFDITTEAMKWMGYTPQASGYCNRGLMIKNSNEAHSSKARTIRTSDWALYGSPYVAVNYHATIEDGTYYIQNVQCNLFLDVEVENSELGDGIELYNIDTSIRQEWTVTRGTNGFYSIMNVANQRYLSVSNNSWQNNTQIVFTDNTNATGAQWAILQSASGNYIFLPQCGISYNRCLSTSVTTPSIGTIPHQMDYTNNSNYVDEWKVYEAEKVVGILQTWWSSGDVVQYRDSTTITIYAEDMVSANTEKFREAVNHAVNQWQSALGVAFELYFWDAADLPLNFKNNADIRIYCVDEAEYMRLKGGEESWPTGSNNVLVAGVTPSRTEGIESYAFYNNQLKKIYKCEKRTSYILGNTNVGIAQFKKIITHELGHSLGYNGEITLMSYLNYVMYESMNSYNVLQDEEKLHLKQVYDLMR